MTTIIKTQRLVLSTWQKQHVDVYFNISQDSKVIEFLPRALTMEQVNDFIPALNSYQDKHRSTLSASCLKETGELMGFIGLDYMTFESNFMPVVEIGWRLASECWDKNELGLLIIEYNNHL